MESKTQNVIIRIELRSETQDVTTKIILRLEGVTKQVTSPTIGRGKNYCEPTIVRRECCTRM
jgi:hypothetical protein